MSRTTAAAVAALALVVLPAHPALAAVDDRLLLVEESVGRTEVRQADGSDSRELVAGTPEVPTSVRGGSWLPDGSGVVLLDQPYAGGRPGTPSVVLVARDGSQRLVLATGGGVTGVPDVSPDGRTVAFGAGTGVDVVGTDGAGRRTLVTSPDGTGVGAVRWSPTGGSVAWVGSDRATGAPALYRSTGSSTERVSAPDDALTGSGFTWHPDGTGLAYAAARPSGSVVVVTDGTAHRELGAGQDPAWSPDGRSVALVAGTDLRVVDADSGSEVRSWSAPDECRLSRPSWSPDAAQVAFSFTFTSTTCDIDAQVLTVATGEVVDVPGVRAAQYGYGLTFAPLPTSAPAARPVDRACPDDRVPEDGFTDTVASVFEADVDCVTWWGMARGTSATTFAPAAPVTRVQTALFLARLLTAAGVGPDRSDAGFTDTAGLPAEARDAVDLVAGAGVARGTTTTTFSPGDRVTRGQLASFLARLQRALGVPLPARVHCFHDTWASVHRAAAEQLCTAGVALGDGRGSFAPGQAVTRAQVAGLLARSLDLAVEAGRVSPPGS